MSNATQSPPTLADLHAQRANILQVAAQHGVSNIRVVGSVARGEATPRSDVDLLVTLPPHCSIFDLVELWMELKNLLGYDLSLIPDSADAPAFIEGVLADAVPL